MEFREYYKKPFLGSKPTQAASVGVQNAVQSGLLTTAGVHATALINSGAPNGLGVGVVAFVNANGVSVTNASSEVTTGKMLYLANTSFHTVDQIGNQNGYQAPRLSRGINPRHIHSFQKFLCAAPEPAVCHLGNTNFTATTTLTIAGGGSGYPNDGTFNNVPIEGGSGSGMFVTVVIDNGEVVAVEDTVNGSGYVAGEGVVLGDIPDQAAPTTAAQFDITEYGSCNYTFYCGRTYDLHVQIGGAPVIAAQSHEVARILSAYGGCCSVDGEETPIDSTLIFLQWAKEALNSEYFKHYVRPVVYDQTGQPWFPTAAEAVAAGYAATYTFDQYISPNYIPGTLGGIRWQGSYADTKTGNCSFRYTDSTGTVDPVKIIAMSLMSDATELCKTKLCFVCESAGYPGQGFGEDVLREFIDSTGREAKIYDDEPRMREILQGDQLLAAINRNGLYTRYVLRHSVVKNGNFSSVNEDVHYELNYYVPCSGATSPTTAAFETLVTTWLASVNSEVSLQTYGHTVFVPAAI